MCIFPDMGLLRSRVNPSGAGSNHDLLGRFPMGHPRGTVARFEKGCGPHTTVLRGRRVD